MITRGGLYFLEESTYASTIVREVDKVFHCGRTDFQEVVIAHSPILGTFLALDGQVQSSELDYYVYHEAMVHTCMVALNDPQSALVVGGGEGTTAAELLRYKGLEIDWVEIDRKVVDLCRRYLPYALRRNNSRVKLVIGDGIDFIKRGRTKYDLILCDMIEPYVNPIAGKIYSKEFASEVSERLTDQGMYVTLSWERREDEWKPATVPRYLEDLFPIIRPIHFFMPSFGMDFTLSIASKLHDPSKVDRTHIEKRIRSFKKSLLFYNAETHRSLFDFTTFSENRAHP